MITVHIVRSRHIPVWSPEAVVVVGGVAGAGVAVRGVHGPVASEEAIGAGLIDDGVVVEDEVVRDLLGFLLLSGDDRAQRGVQKVSDAGNV